MATIPGTPRREGMPGTPNLRLGTGGVSANDLGAANYQAWERLGQNLGMTGRNLQQWGIQKYNEEADADALMGINDAMKRRGEESNRLMTLQGAEAAGAPEAYAEFSRKVDDDILGTLKTPRAKEAYQRRMMGYDLQRGQALDAHKLREHESYVQTGLAASVQQEMDNASLNAGNGKGVVDAIQRIKGLNAQRYRGMPAEYVDLQNRKDALLTIEGVAATLARNDPRGAQAALDFLNSGAEVEVGGGALKVRYDELKKHYEATAVNADVQANAMRAVDDGIGSAEAMRYAAETWPNDQARQNQFLSVFDGYGKRVAIDAQNEKIAAQQASWDEWGSVGYDIQKMPVSFRDDPENWERAIRFASFMKNVDFDTATPNFRALDALAGKPQQEIREWVADGENYLRLLGWTAGRKDELDRILKRSRGEGVDERIPGFKFDEKITKNILRNSVDLSGGWLGDETQMNDAVNAVYDLFQMRMKEEKSATANPEDVYYDLMREVAVNPELLKKSSLDFQKADAVASSENTRVESINPSTGKTEIAIREGEAVYTFEKLTEIDKRAFGDIDIREGWRVPDSADAGTYKGVNFQPGDRIAVGVDSRTGRADAIVVYDENWNLRPESVDVSIARRGEYTGPVLPPEKPEPAKTPHMLAWERENKSTFVWQKYADRWVAEAVDVNDPNSKAIYEANPEGSFIQYTGARSVTDADFLSEAPDAPEVGNEILEQIAALEVQIADSEKDPRSRKDVEHDKRLEVERLKAEYERVTGKKAKESQFYVASNK